MREIDKVLSLFDNMTNPVDQEKQKMLDELELLKDNTNDKFIKQSFWIENNFDKVKAEHVRALLENGILLVKIKNEIEKIRSQPARISSYFMQ